MSGRRGWLAAGKQRGVVFGVGLTTLGALVLWALTCWSMEPVSAKVGAMGFGAARIQLSDRDGSALNSIYTNQWNLFEQATLHSVPERLVVALLLAEDQRFYRHRGQDWLARLRALAQNIGAGEVVSGASTISEQVVRMLNPRPRTLWSRWLEGWEAGRLEQSLGKEAILEFYLNQVPYAARRRGVVQAARYYFDRDLATLSVAEMLALAVLIRAPSRLDPVVGDRQALHLAMTRLARRMVVAGKLASEDVRQLDVGSLKLRRPRLAVNLSLIHI